MNERTEELASDLPRWLRSFDAAAKFSGPSLYFHLRTLVCLYRHPSAVDALSSEKLFDWLYATLASWGMHRMGRGSTRLRELPEIKASVRLRCIVPHSRILRGRNRRAKQLHPAGDTRHPSLLLA